jgi:hypothetical protein
VDVAYLGSESETCVGSRVRLVGVSISFEKNFYRLPFTPPLSGSPYRSFTRGFEREEGRLDPSVDGEGGEGRREGIPLPSPASGPNLARYVISCFVEQ